MAEVDGFIWQGVPPEESRKRNAAKTLKKKTIEPPVDPRKKKEEPGWGRF